MNRTSVEDEDLYRVRDGILTCNFDRTKYNYNYYWYAPHQLQFTLRGFVDKDHPDDPKPNFKPQFNRDIPYGMNRYYKYYGYSQNMRIM